MSDQDNLRDRIAELIDPNAWKMHRIPEMPGWPESTELIEPSREKAQAIIDDLHLESYPFTRHAGHTTTHVHGWMEPQP